MENICRECMGYGINMDRRDGEQGGDRICIDHIAIRQKRELDEDRGSFNEDHLRSASALTCQALKRL